MINKLKMLKKYNQTIHVSKVFIYIFLVQFTLFSLFAVIFSLYRYYFQSSIIFYSGLKIIFLLLIFYAIFFYLFKRRIKIRFQETLLHLCLFVFISYSFLITSPALLDRSISLVLISSIAESNNDGISKVDLQNIFLEHYVSGYHVIDKRLHEQLNGKTIQKIQERYFITAKGKRIYVANQFFATIFHIDKKLLVNIPRKAR